MNDLKEKLISFGLFEKEAEAYLRLLKDGEATVDSLADQSFDFTDTLVALDSLADKQLVQKVTTASRVYYKVNDPENVLQNLKVKRAQAEVSKDKLERAMMNLNWFYDQHEKPKEVKAYSGYEGVLEVRRKIFIQVYDNIYNVTSLHKSLPKNHIQSLLQHVKDKYYLIIPATDIGNLEEVKEIIVNEPKLEVKVMNNNIWKEKAEVLIFGKTAAFGNIEDQQFFTVIEDEVVAKTMEKVFMSLWGKSSGIDIK